jgi:hypothetical protein
MQLAERLDPGPPFAWSGEFRRLDLPGQTLRGVLAIDEVDGVTLRLFGTFSDTHPFGSLLNAPRPEWTLQGNIEDGEAVTIIGARHVGGREQHPGAVELHLKADAAMIGDRLVDLTTRFDQVAIAYDELAMWTSGPGTPVAGWSNVEPAERSPRRLGRLAFWRRTPTVMASSMRPISYQDRAEARADVPGLGSVSLIARGVVRPIPGGANLTEEAEFKVVTSQPLTLQEVDDDVRVPLDRLLALAFDRKVTRRHLRVRIEGDEPPPAVAPLPRRPRRSALDDDRWLFVLTGRESPRLNEPRRPRLLSFHATSATFESLIVKWIQLHRHQGRALNYFFETAYGGERFVDRGLLTAIQAIEGYHRTDTPVSPEAQAAFEADRVRAKDIVTANGLQQRVVAGPSGFEPPLSERIRDLLSRQMPEVTTRRQRAPLNAFSDRVAKLRNGLAHLLDRSDDFTFLEMYEYRQNLLTLMKLELFRQLGATVEQRVVMIDQMQWPAPPGLFNR